MIKALSKGKVFLTTVILLFSLGCAKPELVTELAREEHVDLAYGQHGRQKLDVYLPEKRSEATKVIVLLHGGSWYEGDKSSLTELARFFQGKGYACVTMNYRLTNTAENNIHPAQVNDVHSAISFLASKASEWNISGEDFALLGASAGAHLALLYSYGYDADDRVKTVISVAAPTDFTSSVDSSPQGVRAVELLLGTTLQENPTAYHAVSPINHVGADSKPTLIFHGRKDLLVPVRQAIDLKARLDQFKVPNKLVVYEDAGHEVLNTATLPSFFAEVDAWLGLYFGN